MLTHINQIFSRLWSSAAQLKHSERNDADVMLAKKLQAKQANGIDTVVNATAPTHGLAPSHGFDTLASAKNSSDCIQTYGRHTAHATALPALHIKKDIADLYTSQGFTITPARINLEAAKEILESNIAQTQASTETRNTLVEAEIKAAQMPTSAGQTLLDNQINLLSRKIDEELMQPTVNFEKLQALVYKLIMGLMRRNSKTDQEFITEMGNQIKAQTALIQGTYNTWPTLVITIFSAGVSVAGGAMGLAPLAPASYITAERAKDLLAASQTFSQAGTGLQSLSSLTSNKSEGQRQVFQIMLQRLQGKEEDRKGAKHKNGETGKEARDSLKSAAQTEHDTIRTMLGGN